MVRNQLEIELRAIERRLRFQKHTQEDSSLATLHNDFPYMHGKSFSNWLDYFNQADGISILEIGGGPHQRVAREILHKYPTSVYVGVEKRRLLKSAEEELSTHANYSFIHTGISKMVQK